MAASTITHKCSPGGECFCVYDPECNPDGEFRQYVPKKLADDLATSLEAFLLAHGNASPSHGLSERARTRLERYRKEAG